MTTNCQSCGMPMEKPEHHGGSSEINPYCKYCADFQGNLLPRETVRENMVQFNMKAYGKDRRGAEADADNLMAQMPAWNGQSAVNPVEPDFAGQNFSDQSLTGQNSFSSSGGQELPDLPEPIMTNQPNDSQLPPIGNNWSQSTDAEIDQDASADSSPDTPVSSLLNDEPVLPVNSPVSVSPGDARSLPNTGAPKANLRPKSALYWRAEEPREETSVQPEVPSDESVKSSI